MAIGSRASTGISGLDQVIDMLRLGDNVVWQVGSIEGYENAVAPFVAQAKSDGRRLVYMRFGDHKPLLNEKVADKVYAINPAGGFEAFATTTHQIIEKEGRDVFYVFDCLSDLLPYWYSDLMIGNFFWVTCPFLYTLNTIAYFALMRGTHTNNTIARIRTTTQVLLDLYRINDSTYIHPLKVWERYSPTMFFPHLIEGNAATSVTASSEAAMLFSGIGQLQQQRDYWEVTLDQAKDALDESEEQQTKMKRLLIKVIFGRGPNISNLADEYFTLPDLLSVAAREVGTGCIGGKSVGFLLARRILDTNASEEIRSRIEPHDSFYLGSDIFYTYIVQNGLWGLRMRQKHPDGYYSLAEELQEELLRGTFPESIREQFMQLLEYFGQSPIIVRSSSLQEDDYGNAFAGKYDSVFCANQGSPEERYAMFEQAVRTVYASTMNENALRYRVDRGLSNRDEQMAVLVQRVSGDHYEELFYPHVAGVGNSVNLYLWESGMDPTAGMIRLVCGLGTRAVDRVSGDYARIVALDQPEKSPPVYYDEAAKFSQHQADVLDLQANKLSSIPVGRIASTDLRADKSLFFTPDRELMARMREAGRKLPETPIIVDFERLLGKTSFPTMLRDILSLLEDAYGYPVDVEFTGNFCLDGTYRVNMLQCRTLQTSGLKGAQAAPDPPDDAIFFKTTGNFMGGNNNIPIDYVVMVRPREYLALTEQDKYQVARLVGRVNEKLRDNSVLLLGPGRWGTTTPSLGVPVHFAELSHTAAICEIAYKDMMPELSFGSHFFQDLVESDIFYMAMYGDAEDTSFHPERLEKDDRILAEIAEESGEAQQAILVAKTPGLVLFSDIVSQAAICYFNNKTADQHEGRSL